MILVLFCYIYTSYVVFAFVDYLFIYYEKSQ